MDKSIFSVKHSDCLPWVRYLTLDRSTVARQMHITGKGSPLLLLGRTVAFRKL